MAENQSALAKIGGFVASELKKDRVRLDTLENAKTKTFTLTENTLTITADDDSTMSVDLSKYLDNDAAVVKNVTYDAPNKNLVFTREDGTSFTVDASIFFDDTNLVTSVAGKTGVVTLEASDVGAIASAEKGVANGVATLDSEGLIPQSQVPYLGDIEAALEEINGV